MKKMAMINAAQSGQRLLFSFMNAINVRINRIAATGTEKRIANPEIEGRRVGKTNRSINAKYQPPIAAKIIFVRASMQFLTLRKTAANVA